MAHSGVDHRREMNESLATLVRLILRGQPRAYRWHPQMRATLLDLLKQLRNPETGWWGERYMREGRIDFVDDMSLTFHIVNYLKGEVPDLDKVGSTLLELKDLEYPIGWLENGGYLTHHNMDVVVLFQYAWPHMNEIQRRVASGEIEKMLQWCLKDAVLPDGSFRSSTSGDQGQVFFPFRDNYFSRLVGCSEAARAARFFLLLERERIARWESGKPAFGFPLSHPLRRRPVGNVGIA